MNIKANLVPLVSTEQLATPYPEPGCLEAKSAAQAAGEGNWQQAIASLDQAIRLSPKNPDFLAQMGAYLFQTGKLDAAASACRRALKIDPRRLPAISNLASILLQQEQLGEAEKLFKQASELAPNQPEVWLNYCGAIVDTPSREDEAAVYAQRALDLAPRHLKAHLFLCKALLNQGRPEAAKAIAERAAAIAPRNAEVHFRIGLCAMLLGRLTEAEQHFSLTLTITPREKKTCRLLAEILTSINDYPAAVEAIRQGAAEKGDHWFLAQTLFFLKRHPESLAEIEAEFSFRDKDLPPASKTKRDYTIAPVSSVKDWCTSRGLPIKETLPEKRIVITAPTFIDGSGIYHPPETTQVIIPPAYLATVKDTLLYPEREVILVDGGKHALYNTLAALKDGYALDCCETLPMMSDDMLATVTFPPEKTEIESGIYLISDAAQNYSHWITEVLTRFHALAQRPELHGTPLLIPPGLYPQQLETIRLMARGNYPIHALQAEKTLKVRNLIFPSTPIGHFKNRRKPNDPPLPSEATFHPEAILHVRKCILDAIPDAKEKKRKLWISRKTQTSYRRFLNENEIEEIFIKSGFESIQPEKLSFSEQVRLFSETEIIAGGTGAGMANMVFARENATIIMFTAYHPLANFNYFNNMAKINDQKLWFVLGEMLKKVSMRNVSYQNDFSVDPELARTALNKLETNSIA
jgi:Flp pilus assembly protein TadD